MPYVQSLLNAISKQPGDRRVFGNSADYSRGYANGQCDLRIWTNREIASINANLSEWMAYARTVEQDRDAALARARSAERDLAAVRDANLLQDARIQQQVELISQLRADVVATSQRLDTSAQRSALELQDHRQTIRELDEAITALATERTVLIEGVASLAEKIRVLDPSDETPLFVWHEIELDRDIALERLNLVADTIKRALVRLPFPA